MYIYIYVTGFIFGIQYSTEITINRSTFTIEKVQFENSGFSGGYYILSRGVKTSKELEHALLRRAVKWSKANNPFYIGSKSFSFTKPIQLQG